MPRIHENYVPSVQHKLYRHIKKFVRHIQPWTPEQYINSHDSTSKIKMYQMNYDKYLKNHKIPAVVLPFTKIEKMSTSKYKAPRMIQGRHPTFNIFYGRYLKPLEKLITKTDKSSSRFFGKGSYDILGEKIYRLSKRYRYYTEGDHETFDSHVTPEQLRVTHTFYNACYNSPELRALSKRTIKNFCFGRNGVNYVVNGTRMSGDVDTGFGNSLINYAILKEVLSIMGIKGEALINGDDFILFTNEPIDITKFTQLLLTFNMVTQMKPSTTNIHTVEFCRCKMVTNSAGDHTMLMDGDRLNSLFGMTYTTEPKLYHKFLLEVAQCNAYLNANNPLGYHWSKAFDVPISKEQIETSRLLDSATIHKLRETTNRKINNHVVTVSQYEAQPDIDNNIRNIYKLAEIVHDKRYNNTRTSHDLLIFHDTGVVVRK